jgi:hypothetical protein
MPIGYFWLGVGSGVWPCTYDVCGSVHETRNPQTYEGGRETLLSVLWLTKYLSPLETGTYLVVPTVKYTWQYPAVMLSRIALSVHETSIFSERVNYGLWVSYTEPHSPDLLYLVLKPLCVPGTHHYIEQSVHPVLFDVSSRLCLKLHVLLVVEFLG